MNGSKERKLYRISTIITAMMFVGIFCPWLTYRNQSYTIIGFYSAVKKAGGISAFARSDSFIYPAVITLAIPLIAGLVAGVKVIFQLFRGRVKTISWMLYSLEWIYMASFFAFEGYQPTLFAIGGPVLALIDFLVNRFMEDYRLLTRKNRALREREQRERRERKERLFFPGRYSWKIHYLILSSVEDGRKYRAITILIGSVTTAYTFCLFALKQSMQQIHSSEVLFLGNGLEADMKSALSVACILDVIIVGLAVTKQLSGRSLSDERMIKLGAREKLIRLNWFIETAVCFVLSIILGIGIGIAELKWIIWMISKEIKIRLVGTITFSAIIFTVMLIGLIFLITVVYAYNNEIQKKYFNLIRAGKDRIPSRREEAIFLICGTVAYVLGLFLFMQRRNAESIWLYVGQILGMLLLFVAIAAIVVRRRDSMEYHQLGMISKSEWLFSFRKLVGNTLVMVILISMLTVPIVQTQIMSCYNEKIAKLVPYDFVSFGYSKDNGVYNQVKKYSRNMQKIPMVRVTSVEGDPYDWKDAAANKFMGVLWPQGQNIGISWTSYIELCKLRGISPGINTLDNNKILISYQQDCVQKVHPIDYYLFRRKPYLRIGQPLRNYVVPDREKLYPQRDVQAELSQNIIGMLNRGDQENLIVFSDEFFKKTYKSNVAGPSYLYLINSKEGKYKRIEKLLNQVAEENKDDASFDSSIQSYYGKQQLLSDIQSERYFQKTMLVHEIIMMTICYLLVLISYAAFIKKRVSEKYTVLQKLGISEKVKHRILRKELVGYGLWPALLSIWITDGYLIEMVQLRGIDAKIFLKILFQGVPYWGMIIIATLIVFRQIYRTLCRGDERRKKKWKQLFKRRT